MACSGGPDSLALAAAAGFLAAGSGRRPGRPQPRAGAVVVDHGWFAGSDLVARRAADRCAELGLSPVLLRRVWDPAEAPSAGGGPEAAARRSRYALLQACAEQAGARAVLLGHTREDQAETVLLGLARGSGARSLAGMPRRRGVFRRPLLDLPRACTHEACRVLGLQPWADPANEDPAYARTRARRSLAVLEQELGPGIAAALARSAAMLREDADLLEELADRAAEELAAGQPETSGPATAELAGLPAALRTRVLRRLLLAAGCPANDLTREHVLAVQGLVTGWRGQAEVQLPGGVRARRACGRLSLARPREQSGGRPAGHG